MCVMLRTQGVPCRVAVGYVLDQGAGNETTYIVRKDNAYSWVEVFFPGYGWINFNPTADRPQGGADGLGSIGFQPSDEPFIEPNLDELFPGPETDPANGTDVGAALAENPEVHNGLPWTLILSLAGALAAMVAIALSGRVAWNWGLGGLDGRTRLWAKVQRLAGWAGLGSRAAETPREWSKRLGKAIDREPEAVQLSDAYEESRYGRPDLVRIDDVDTEASYTSLRNALVAKLTRRKSRRRP
jgi:hypothetical protein